MSLKEHEILEFVWTIIGKKQTVIETSFGGKGIICVVLEEFLAFKYILDLCRQVKNSKWILWKHKN